MSTKITILAPESEIPAEGADAAPLADAQPAASDLLAAYGNLFADSSLTFTVSADGAVAHDGDPGEEPLLTLDLAGEAGAEPALSLSEDAPRATLDLGGAAASVTEAFDAEDGVRKLVANIATGLRGSLGDGAGAPVPLIRWQKDEADTDGEGGGVAQLLGVWLAGDEEIEALRAGGGEGIIFDEDEVEGRGLREAVTAFAVLGVMMAGSVSAEAGLFRRASKSKDVKVERVQSQNRQAPASIDRQGLAESSTTDTMVIVDVSKQRAYLLSKGRVVLDTPVSTAREGKHTPRGEFKITQRVAHGKTSTIYGCDLPYWMRLDQSAIGLHVGDLPGYPASAGCIRLPSNIAPVMFEHTKSGTTVRVVDSWQPGIQVAMN